MTLAVAEPIAVDFGHVEPVLVHFDELDPMGVLHNARYAVLLERVLASYWGVRGYSFENGQPTAPDVVHAVREFTITYQRPVRGTGWIAIHFWLERFGTTSADYAFRFLSLDGETVFAEGRRSIVRVDLATLRPTPWTDGARQVAAGLLRPGAA
jgi:acyl-CoA thioester hydrolase